MRGVVCLYQLSPVPNYIAMGQAAGYNKWRSTFACHAPLLRCHYPTLWRCDSINTVHDASFHAGTRPAPSVKRDLFQYRNWFDSLSTRGDDCDPLSYGSKHSTEKTDGVDARWTATRAADVSRLSTNAPASVDADPDFCLRWTDVDRLGGERRDDSVLFSGENEVTRDGSFLPRFTDVGIAHQELQYMYLTLAVFNTRASDSPATYGALQNVLWLIDKYARYPVNRTDSEATTQFSLR